jgi:hypothetical protein
VRACGSCRACCTAIEVHEEGTHRSGEAYRFDKPMGQPCAHLVERGCALHGKPGRPWQCRTFLCLWRLGLGDDDATPQGMGLLASFEHVPGEGAVAMVWELRPGAHRTGPGRRFVRALWRVPDLVGVMVHSSYSAPRLFYSRRAQERIARGTAITLEDPVRGDRFAATTSEGPIGHAIEGPSLEQVHRLRGVPLMRADEERAFVECHIGPITDEQDLDGVPSRMLAGTPSDALLQTLPIQAERFRMERS